MKNPILGIENPYLGPLFKRISIFEKKIDHDLKFWILDFYAIFSLPSEQPNIPHVPKSIFSFEGVGRSNQC